MEYNSNFVSFGEESLKHSNRLFDAMVYGLHWSSLSGTITLALRR